MEGLRMGCRERNKRPFGEFCPSCLAVYLQENIQRETNRWIFLLSVVKVKRGTEKGNPLPRSWLLHHSNIV